MISTSTEFKKLGEFNPAQPDYSLLRIPSKEPTFEVDLNKRTIKVPAEFSPLAVQGDHRAEIIYFKMARFFDAVDLDTKDIRILWKRSDKVLGVSSAIFKDTKEEEIYFGWVINEDVTKYSGAITFSIDVYSTEGNEINYRLSTLPVTVKINAGLDTSTSASVISNNGEEQAILNLLLGEPG